MEKRTVIDQVEITRDGTINLRMAKEVVDDDGTVLQSGLHRTSFPPGHDIDAQMAAVNAGLVRDLKMPAVAADDFLLLRLKETAPLVWTDAVKQGYADKIAAAAKVAVAEVARRQK
jgi:hypothetical protein